MMADEDLTYESPGGRRVATNVLLSKQDYQRLAAAEQRAAQAERIIRIANGLAKLVYASEVHDADHEILGRMDAVVDTVRRAEQENARLREALSLLMEQINATTQARSFSLGDAVGIYFTASTIRKAQQIYATIAAAPEPPA